MAVVSCAGNGLEQDDAAALGKILEATAPGLTSLILADNDLQVCLLLSLLQACLLSHRCLPTDSFSNSSSVAQSLQHMTYPVLGNHRQYSMVCWV